MDWSISNCCTAGAAATVELVDAADGTFVGRLTFGQAEGGPLIIRGFLSGLPTSGSSPGRYGFDIPTDGCGAAAARFGADGFPDDGEILLPSRITGGGHRDDGSDLVDVRMIVDKASLYGENSILSRDFVLYAEEGGGEEDLKQGGR